MGNALERLRSKDFVDPSQKNRRMKELFDRREKRAFLIDVARDIVFCLYLFVLGKRRDRFDALFELIGLKPTREKKTSKIEELSLLFCKGFGGKLFEGARDRLKIEQLEYILVIFGEGSPIAKKCTKSFDNNFMIHDKPP